MSRPAFARPLDPRSDQGVDAPDQVADRQQTDAAPTDRNPAIRRVVAIAAHDEKVVWRDHGFDQVK
jgi:hypothetical protein